MNKLILRSNYFQNMSSPDRLKVLLRIARLQIKIRQFNNNHTLQIGERIQFENGMVFDA